MKVFVFLLSLSVIFPIVASGDPQLTSKNVETLELTSNVFDNTRTIRILLPPDYRATKNQQTAYPVFYFNDGLMVFDQADPGLKIESIVYDLYQKDLLPPLLIIGVDNGACTDKTKNELVDRANEFLPYPDAGFSPGHTYKPEPPDPIGKRYPDFLIQEVMPLVAHRYRIKSGAENTGLGGFSYGGVSALYTVIARPKVFGKLLVESAPLWIGPHYELLHDTKNATNWPEWIYLGSGSKETDEEAFNEEGEKNQKLLRTIIEQNSKNTLLKVVRQSGATHGTAAWRERLSAALQFLFKTSQ